MKRFFRVSVVVAVAFVLGIIVDYVVSGQSITTTATGALRKFDGAKAGPPAVCTTGIALVDMPDMVKPFSIAGSASEEVALMFSGDFKAVDPGDFSVVLFFIDGVQVGTTVRIAADHDSVGTFAWFSDPLSPGAHVAKVQWNAGPGSATVCVEERSLIVLHK